ncbi:MAG: hypothetical protein QM759_05935 [Terricaulis sp.]
MLQNRAHASFARTFAAALCAVALASGGASAQTQSWAGPHFFPQEAPDNAVAEVMQIVIAHITDAHDANGNALPPLSADEQAAPLLDPALSKEVMDIAAASGIGQVCALDWQNLNYLRLMARERARGDRTPHQLAAIGLLHGLVQSEVAHDAGTCNDAFRQAAQTFYAAKWGAEAH